jgi:predicted membrane chloride channel (bestrophin family)
MTLQSNFEILTNDLEIDLLFGLLSWARNDAFARWAEACAYWGALVDSHTYLQELSGEIMYHSLY